MLLNPLLCVNADWQKRAPERRGVIHRSRSAPSDLPQLPRDPGEIESYLSGFTNFEKQLPLGDERRSLGPRRAAALLEEAGLLPASAPVIQVAGTKGKGSVVLWMEALLAIRKRRTAAAISPHLEELGERIRIDGRPSTAVEMLRTLEFLQPPLDRILERTPELRPTFFDLFTTMAIARANQESVDTILLEVGLGGPLDSTSAIPNDCGVLTTVDLDHCELLGNSVEEIACEKAGIARKDRPFLIAESGQPWQAQAAGVARRRGARVEMVATDPRLPEELDETQKTNLSLALAALEITLDLEEFSPPEIARASAEVSLPARLEVLEGQAPMLLDCAHTPISMAAFSHRLERWSDGKRATVLLGMLSDKRSKEVLSPLLSLAPVPELWLVTPPSTRGWDVGEAKAHLADLGFSARRWHNLEQALEELEGRALAGHPAAVTGSVILAGKVRGWWLNQEVARSTTPDR